MKAEIDNLKADLYEVFVIGDANDKQMTKVYLLITIPVIVLLLAIGRIY